MCCVGAAARALALCLCCFDCFYQHAGCCVCRLVLVAAGSVVFFH